jgi:hypothetical protein
MMVNGVVSMTKDMYHHNLETFAWKSMNIWRYRAMSSGALKTIKAEKLGLCESSLTVSFTCS